MKLQERLRNSRSCDELCDEAANRIDADEALMREAYDLLESYCGYFHLVEQLRKRLEKSE